MAAGWHRGANKRSTIAALLILLSMAVACAPAIEPVMGVRGPTRSVRAGAELAHYSFLGPAGWDLFDYGEEIARSRLEGDALELTVGADQGYLTAGDNVIHRDLLVYARVRLIEGLQGSGLGLLCRADKVGNGYWFLISGHGEFSIQVANASREQPFALVPWRYHSAIRQMPQANELRIVCADNYLAFLINDVFVAEAFDHEFREGELAVALGAAGRRARARFDDIRVRAATVTGSR